MRLLIAIIALLAFVSPAAATGFIEGLVFSALLATGSSLAGSALAISALTALVTIGLSVGLSLLANSLFTPSQSAPRPEDMQQSSRQPLQPRARHYGRVKISGPWIFAEASGGNFHKVIALGQGELDAIEEFWLDDREVEIDVGGTVITPIGLDGVAKPVIKYRLGAPSQAYYSELGAVYPSWTPDHRGDGVASLYVRQAAVPQENYLAAYSNGINTSYRVVARGVQVWNPVTQTTSWDDNAAAVIRDYMTHSDGMRLPEAIFTTPLAQAGWEVAYNRCAEGVELAVGGTEPRYRLWGSYVFSERPADVLGRMLACSDGRVVPTPDGGLTLDTGEWYEPTVIIDEDAIVGFADLSRGRDIMTAANVIRATFLDPDGDYQASDADPWVDAEDVSLRGEMAIDRRFEMAPSHSQCRRLMKLASYRSNPEWVGQFRCNLRGLAAFGERLVRIRYPLFLIDEVFEVQDFRFDIGPGGILTGITLQVQSMPSAAYEWDASQEEGDAPTADESQGSGVPTPDAPDVEIIAGPVGRLTLPAVDEVFVYQARYKKTADSSWTEIEADEGAATVDTDTLDAATEYEFQLRLKAVALGLVSQWSASTIESTD